jgi:hypothetical protein
MPDHDSLEPKLGALAQTLVQLADVAQMTDVAARLKDGALTFSRACAGVVVACRRWRRIGRLSPLFQPLRPATKIDIEESSKPALTRRAAGLQRVHQRPRAADH